MCQWEAALPAPRPSFCRTKWEKCGQITKPMRWWCRDICRGFSSCKPHREHISPSPSPSTTLHTTNFISAPNTMCKSIKLATIVFPLIEPPSCKPTPISLTLASIKALIPSRAPTTPHSLLIASNTETFLWASPHYKLLILQQRKTFSSSYWEV